VITGDVDFENVSKKQVLLPLFLVEWAYDSDVIKKYAVGKRNENVEIRK
jgi:hypothetical protein